MMAGLRQQGDAKANESACSRVQRGILKTILNLPSMWQLQ
jgi:hypothetical protein